RFSNEEIKRILSCLQLERIRWQYGFHPLPEEAFCILLYRLAYPHCLKDCWKIFGCSRTRLSVVFNDTIMYLIERYQETLLWDKRRLTLSTLQRYAKAIENSSSLCGIWGFVDGTMRPFCRPGDDQRSFYSGYKKAHAFKFQSIVTPDRLLSTLAGP
ncbi:hypothetical protein HOY82DRAFT_469202, partial [Tuber indicum]